MRPMPWKSILFFSGGLPIWLFLVAVVPQSTGWCGHPLRFVTAPLVLVGVTVAIHRLFRGQRDAWAVSSLLAGVITLDSLYTVYWISR